jgi:hypothetical protein
MQRESIHNNINMNVGLAVALAVAIALLIVYATRPMALIGPTSIDSVGSAASMYRLPMTPEDDGSMLMAPPPPGSSGFGSLVYPCSTLTRRTDQSKQGTPELDGYFEGARADVPVELPVYTDGCPPMRPMSSSLPMANMPMCMFNPQDASNVV